MVSQGTATSSIFKSYFSWIFHISAFHITSRPKTDTDILLSETAFPSC